MDGHGSLDAEASAALIAEQQARVEAAIDVDGRILFSAWGVAWMLGFGLLWATALDAPLVDLDRQTALLVFAGLLALAGAVTAVHLSRRSSGVRGTSARQGAMHGWAWSLGFGMVGALGVALGRQGVSEELMAFVMMTTSLIVVASLFMAGGAMWDAPTQWAIGAVVAVVTIVAVLVGLPHTYLVMCLGGGGALLAGAVVEAARRRRTREH